MIGKKAGSRKLPFSIVILTCVSCKIMESVITDYIVPQLHNSGSMSTISMVKVVPVQQTCSLLSNFGQAGLTQVSVWTLSTSITEKHSIQWIM